MVFPTKFFFIFLQLKDSWNEIPHYYLTSLDNFDIPCGHSNSTAPLISLREVYQDLTLSNVQEKKIIVGTEPSKIVQKLRGLWRTYTKTVIEQIIVTLLLWIHHSRLTFTLKPPISLFLPIHVPKLRQDFVEKDLKFCFLRGWANEESKLNHGSSKNQEY